VSASLTGVALVTGASGGTGRAVARALAERGMGLCLTGRDAGRLQDSAREIRSPAARIVVRQADLSTDGGIRGLVEDVSTDFGRIDVLVHAAGTLCLGNVEAAGWEDLDEQYRVNLRAPFLLTKALLPMLLDVSGRATYTDFIGVVSGRSDRQVDAIAENVREVMERRGWRLLGREGSGNGRWTLLDFGDVVLHVFYHPVREIYDIEGLWIDAPRIQLAVPPEAQLYQSDALYGTL